MPHPIEPPSDCGLCPRLASFRQANKASFPGHFNAPVPAFSADRPRLLIIGLAPGLHGANRTGRPFTGDYAGELLYPTMIKFGFAHGDYARTAADGLALIGCRITNAVRCVPPQNKPTAMEINTCRQFLVGELAAVAPHLRVILALGAIAHNSVLRALGVRVAAAPFGHAAEHPLGGGLTLLDSYHCSRYNTNTGRLTSEMFEAVFARAADICSAEFAQ